MNPLFKGAVALGTVAGAAGASYGIYSAMQSAPEKSTYAKELNGTLLSVNENEDQAKWESRLASLKRATESTLVNELAEIKKKDSSATWQELRNWCKDIINNSSKGKEDKEFLNIQSYCTFSIKEKLTNVIPESPSDNSQWAAGHKALKSIDDSKLDSKLKEAKDKVSGANANLAVKNWCNSAFAEPYKGETDQKFENTKKVCTKASD